MSYVQPSYPLKNRDFLKKRSHCGDKEINRILYLFVLFLVLESWFRYCAFNLLDGR